MEQVRAWNLTKTVDLHKNCDSRIWSCKILKSSPASFLIWISSKEVCNFKIAQECYWEPLEPHHRGEKTLAKKRSTSLISLTSWSGMHNTKALNSITAKSCMWGLELVDPADDKDSTLVLVNMANLSPVKYLSCWCLGRAIEVYITGFRAYCKHL